MQSIPSVTGNGRPGSVQEKKAQAFRALHHGKSILLLPNIWDASGAVMLEQLGYQAVATASAAVSRSLGFEDGEHIPFDRLCWLLSRVAASVSVPVSADIECGYARTNEDLEQNIFRLLETGIVGINIEDSLPDSKEMIPADKQCARIRLIREAANSKGVSIYINARTDVYLRMSSESEEVRLKETLARAHVFLDAGADGIYPIGAKEPETVHALVKGIPAPVNILASPGFHTLKTLQDLGVSRVSMGPKFHAYTLKAMKEMAAELKGLEGLDKIS